MIRWPSPTVLRWCVIALGAVPAFWLGVRPRGAEKPTTHIASPDSVRETEPVTAKERKDRVATKEESPNVQMRKPSMLPPPPVALRNKEPGRTLPTLGINIDAYVADIESEYRQAIKR